MYTNGLVLFSGMVAVAIVMLGVNGFTSTKQVDSVIAYESEDEEIPPDDEVAETIVTVTESEESPPNFDAIKVQDINEEIALIRKSYGYSLRAELTDEPTLKREETIEKNLKTSVRTSVNNIEDAGGVQLLNLTDYTALVRIVEAEATGEDLIGKVLIANVVMNRVDSKRFPNSIYDVVHQKLDGRAQFSPIDDGRYYSVAVTDSTIEAVELALAGQDYSDGALFFVAKSIASEKAGSWFDRHLTFVFKHGVHSFYKY